MTVTIAESFSTDSLDLETLLELSRRTDPIGVLSVYVDARPGALRTASIDIKNRITELERRIAADGSQERSRAVRDGITRLEAEIDRLTDPEEPGRERILFAATERWLAETCVDSAAASKPGGTRRWRVHPSLARAARRRRSSRRRSGIALGSPAARVAPR